MRNIEAILQELRELRSLDLTQLHEESTGTAGDFRPGPRPGSGPRQDPDHGREPASPRATGPGRAPGSQPAPGSEPAPKPRNPARQDFHSWTAHFQDHYAGRDGGRSHVERYIQLLEQFRALFGRRDVFLARVPGRINVIGEHTDYNAGPVLPVAIDRDIVAVFAPRSDATISVHDARGEYGSRSFTVRSRIPPFAQGDWGNYVKAAAQELTRSLARPAGGGGGSKRAVAPDEGLEPDAQSERTASTPSLTGFDALIHSTVPAAAGLSSSSALVVLSGTMLCAANGLSLEPRRFAQLMAEAEHYVGTRGGGMDQTVTILAERDSALFIDFADFVIRSVPLSAQHSFVIAHSLVEAPKSRAARASYNLRAAESRMAGALFRRAAEKELGRSVPHELIGSLRHAGRDLGFRRLRALARNTFHEEPYTADEIASLLAITEEQLDERFHLSDTLEAPEAPKRSPAEAATSTGTGSSGTAGTGGSDRAAAGARYKLYQRFTHVLEESLRVEQVVEALAAGDLREVGRLMDASHESCRDLYEISCPELDELVEIERAAGALGARMTGAGFGGCTICLVETARVEETVAELIKGYYQERRSEYRDDYRNLVFPIRAVPGVSVL